MHTCRTLIFPQVHYLLFFFIYTQDPGVNFTNIRIYFRLFAHVIFDKLNKCTFITNAVNFCIFILDAAQGIGKYHLGVGFIPLNIVTR